MHAQTGAWLGYVEASLFSPFHTFSSLNLQPIQTLNQKSNPNNVFHGGGVVYYLQLTALSKKLISRPIFGALVTYNYEYAWLVTMYMRDK